MEQKKQTILEWYQEKAQFIDAPCNGKGHCGRCKVKFHANAPLPGKKDRELLTQEELAAGIRLACATQMTEIEEFELVGERFVIKNETGVERLEYDGSRGESNLEESLGVAIDIGTTTISMRLIELTHGKELLTLNGINHQRMYGADVISRIEAANAGKLQELQCCIQKDLINMLMQLVKQTESKAEQIKKIAIAANTTMCHLLLGYSCEGLAKAPFKPVALDIKKMTAIELFEQSSKMEFITFLEQLEAEVVILPGISAFVGADIVAGMYYCDMDLKEKPHMLLDVGTNGEIVLGDKNGFLVTSTAAGPVFEGGNISCGVPAVEGAIAHIRSLSGKIDARGEKYQWDVEVLGQTGKKEVQPIGFCGSGLIDLAAELLKKGWIDENGTLCEELFETGVSVCGCCILQSDIRELQMGKAAIRAGIELLQQRNMTDKIFLAGGFGESMDIEAAIRIGLLPQGAAKNVIPMGNTALGGACRFLLDEKAEVRMKNIVQSAKEIELAKEGNFEEKYILFMQFLL